MQTQHIRHQALLINRASFHSQFLFLFCLAFLLSEGKQLRRGGQEAREWNVGSLVPCHQLLPPSSEWGCRSSADGCPKGPWRQVICWEVTTFPQHGCRHHFLAHREDRGHKWWVPFSLWMCGEPGVLYYGFSLPLTWATVNYGGKEIASILVINCSFPSYLGISLAWGLWARTSYILMSTGFTWGSLKRSFWLRKNKGRGTVVLRSSQVVPVTPVCGSHCEDWGPDWGEAAPTSGPSRRHSFTAQVPTLQVPYASWHDSSAWDGVSGSLGAAAGCAVSSHYDLCKPVTPLNSIHILKESVIGITCSKWVRNRHHPKRHMRVSKTWDPCNNVK